MIAFNADLGPVPIFNREKLSAAFSAGLTRAVADSATSKGADVHKAVRILGDAFSTVKAVDSWARPQKSKKTKTTVLCQSS